jgi:hypothetical protein
MRLLPGFCKLAMQEVLIYKQKEFPMAQIESKSNQKNVLKNFSDVSNHWKNLIDNGDFSGGSRSWQLYDAQIRDGYCQILRYGACEQTINIDAGDYELTFEGLSAAGGVRAILYTNSRQDSFEFEAGNEYQVNRVAFNEPEATELRLKFTNYGPSGSTDYVRNVILRRACQPGKELLNDGDFTRYWEISAAGHDAVKFVDGYCLTTGSALLHQEIAAEAETRYLVSLQTRFPALDKAGTVLIVCLPSGAMTILPIAATLEWTRHQIEFVSPLGTETMRITVSGNGMMSDNISVRGYV